MSGGDRGSAVVRLGLLGCADIAVRRMLPAVAQLPGMRLTAVASRHRGKAEAVTARFGGVPVEGYASLLDRDDVDAVYAPLPPGMHAEWVGRALRAGKHVLSEKPLTTDHRSAEALIRLARSTGRVLMENFMFVHHSQHRWVARRIADGIVGDLRGFAATFAIPARPPGDIRLQPALGGGALLDVGGYPLRAARYFLGPALVVASAALRRASPTGVDLGGQAVLRRSDDVTAHLTFGLDDPYRSTYEFTGSEGWLRVSHVFTTPADHRPVVQVCRRGGVETFELDADDQCCNTVEAFRRAVADGVVRAEQDRATHDMATQAWLVDQIHHRAAGGSPADRVLTHQGGLLGGDTDD